MTDKALLRGYVRGTLREDGYDSLSDFGSSFGSGSDLYNVFIKPFADVVGTAAGEVSKVSTKVQTLAKVAFESVATTIVPFLSSDYDEIWKQEDEQIDAIKEKYKDIYDATYTAFHDNDVMVAAFGHSPASFLTKQALKRAPLPVLKTINALTGGKLDRVVDKVAAALKGRDVRKPTSSDSGGQTVASGLVRGGTRLNEVHVNDISRVLDDDKVKHAIASNPKVKEMQSATRGAVRDALAAVYERARTIAAAKGPDDLQKVTKKKVPGLDKLKALPADQRAKVAKQVMASVKKSALKVYTDGLKKRIHKAIESGVPQDHPYVVDHAKTLQKIEAL